MPSCAAAISARNASTNVVLPIPGSPADEDDLPATVARLREPRPQPSVLAVAADEPRFADEAYRVGYGDDRGSDVPDESEPAAMHGLDVARAHATSRRVPV
jgi:hypothetical protein